MITQKYFRGYCNEFVRNICLDFCTVSGAREMLNMLNVWGKSSQKKETFNTFNISPVLSLFGTKTFNISPVSWTWVHETGEMLNVFLEICSKQGKC